MRNNLKVQRAIKNITQAELAKRIGVSRQTINAIESQNYQVHDMGFSLRTMLKGAFLRRWKAAYL